MIQVILLPLLFIWGAFGQDEDNFLMQNFNVKLTGERGGPPQNAQFVPIGVVDLPVFNQKPSSKRPLKGGRPPPPPPISIEPTKPTKRPKPSGPIAPPPPPKPLPVDQGIPQATITEGSGQTVPPLPPNIVMVTPVMEIRPDTETEMTPAPTRPSTTPNTLDALPAISQRFNLHDDGSYDFE